MKKTPEGWVSILSKEKVRGPLTLTNERIFVGNDEVSISIQDIFARARARNHVHLESVLLIYRNIAIYQKKGDIIILHWDHKQ